MTRVEVVRSARRRKTIEARMVDGVLEVRVPARLTAGEVDEAVGDMVRRFEAARVPDEVDLGARATDLARRYDLPEPVGIRWAANQRRRWGSCTPATGQVRISTMLAGFPAWVIDYVVVHELAHLVEPSHGPRFHELVGRYPKAERAEGYLLAMEALDGSAPPADGASVGEPRRSDRLDVTAAVDPEASLDAAAFAHGTRSLGGAQGRLF